MAVALLAIGVYVYIPGTYSKEQPLKSWTFTVALPRAKVERLLVHDFHETAQLWVNGFESVERSSGKLRGSSLVRTGPFDVLTEWTKTGSFTWEQSSRLTQTLTPTLTLTLTLSLSLSLTLTLALALALSLALALTLRLSIASSATAT